MPSIRLTYLLLIILSGFLSCKTDNSNIYSIKDFRKPLQPYLIRIVSKGIGVCYDSALRNMASDNELTQLSKSENPILRACAFQEMLHRKSFNHFDILMNNLSDTATIPTDAGEFGLIFKTVSDYVIQEGEWNSIEEKNNTIKKVITKHNYLASAYFIVQKIEPQEQYYSYIKEMAKRDKLFLEIESALYALAKFKKSEDIPLIKEFFLKNNWQLDELSFRLMKEYPNDTYLDVFEKYYRRNYYNSICRGSNDNAMGFINSIAVYNNRRSAVIIDSILNKKPFLNCVADTGYIKSELVYAIWKNHSEFYSKLRSEVKETVEYYERNRIEFPLDSIELGKDTSKPKIRWW